MLHFPSLKMGGNYKNWKKRWFVLSDNCLYYFVNANEKEPKGIIPLENIQIREFEDRSRPYCFELHFPSHDVIKACKTNKDGKVVTGKHTSYRVSAATAAEKQEWIGNIRICTSHNPFLGMLQARKKKAQHYYY